MSNFTLAWLMVIGSCVFIVTATIGSFFDHRGRLSFLWLTLVIFGLAIIGTVPKEWVSP